MKKTLTLALSVLISVGSAQTAQEIISKVEAAQKAAKDVSFRLSGTANFDSSSQKVDMLVKALPAQNLARIQFNAPDALADNIVVADKNEIRQYMFLTNQITVMSTKSAGDKAGMGGLDFTTMTDAASMLKEYNVKLLGTTGTAGKKVFQLEATSKTGKADDKARIWISEAGWRPVRVQLLASNSKVLADMKLSNYKVNSGLNAATLRALPKDAQIIKQ